MLDALTRYLQPHFPGPLQLLNLRPLTGGASRDTWSFDLVCDNVTHRLILRRDLGGEILDEAIDRAGEFAVLLRAFEGDVKVPRPRWVCTDADVLGTPFLIMDRLEGESIGRRIVREASLTQAREVLPRQMGEQLARIHALSTKDLAFLPRPEPHTTPASWALDRAAKQLHDLGEPHPVLEFTLRRLRERMPASDSLVLVHGDFRIGNLMVDPTGLVGVFDWEFAHLGDPHEDLAWPCVRSWRFGQDAHRLGGVGTPETFFAAYESAGGRKVDPQSVRFWEIVGNLRWAIGCIAQAHRHLSGQAPSVEFASLGRRTCEMEHELLHLIEQTESET